MPAADNQPKARLRFAQAGTDSWYFGIDAVGLYSITNVTPPNVTVAPANQIELGLRLKKEYNVAGIEHMTSCSVCHR